MFGALTVPKINLPMGMGMAGGGTGGEQTSNDGEATNSSILERIAVNTATTVAILSTAVLGTPGENRDKGIEGGETDQPKSKKGGRFGNALKGIGSALDKVNPFSSGFAFGAIGKALLAGGGLLLIKIFGENLIDPLASLLEAIKEGKIGEKIMDIVDKVKTKLLIAFEEVKEATTKFIEAVIKVKDFIMGIYNSINDYIMSFDVNEDGKLDETELDDLKTDVKDRTVKALGGFFEDVMLSIGGLLLGSTLIGLTAKLAYARLLPIFTGVGVPAAGMAGGLATAIPIAGLILYGFTTTYKNITKSLEKTIEEGGDFSDFFANFIGGNDEGGVMNALKQAFLLGGTFALAGMAIGLVGGPVGVLAGGLIGTAVGFVVGAVTGYMGSNFFKEKFDGFTAMIDDSVTTIRNFYSDTIAGFKSMFSGEGFMKGFKARGEADVEGLTKDLEKAEKGVKDIEQLFADNPKLAALEYNQNMLQDAKNEVNRIKALLKDAPAKAKQYNIDQIDDEIESKTKKKEKLQKKVDGGNLMPGIDSISVGIPYETQIKSLDNEIKVLTVQKESADNAQTLEELLAVQEGANFNNAQMVFDNVMKEKYEGLGMTFKDNPQGGGFLVTGNKSQSDNVAVTEVNAGGFTVGNQDTETQYLIASGLGRN